MNTKSKSTLEKLENILRFEAYAENSIKTYCGYAELFLNHFNKDVYHISVSEAENFLLNYSYTSISQQNQIISAIKHLYKKVVGRKLITSKIKRPRKQKKLPRVIDAEQLAIKIKSIKNLKHRAILTLGLSCGLRISEVINMKWEHLDRNRNILKVINGKGNKDRSCVLNNDTIELLENYWKTHRSKIYVFNGQNSLQYSQTSIQNLVKKYIHPKASFHLLRHSYATYAIDNGTELKPLSVSMGHNSTKTIERFYFHQSQRTLKTIKQAI